MILRFDQLPTPVGPLLIAARDGRLVQVEFGEPEGRFLPALRRRFGEDATLRDAEDPGGFTSAFAAYLRGEWQAIENLPLDAGGTPFQRRVWAELVKIPRGQTTTYGALARRLGQPTATRAVGLANGRNPISLAVPCHRVIGSGGKLTGYGGGLERKRWLLEHEGALATLLEK